MDRKQRKNRPKKKEIPPDVWANQFENLKRQFEHDGRRKKDQKEQSSSGDTEEK